MPLVGCVYFHHRGLRVPVEREGAITGLEMEGSGK